MGTRSDIIVERLDGTWKRVYCHWDGYISHNGKMLFEHYNSQERAEAVVAPGDMSSLHEKCDKPEGHSYETKVPGYSVYYGRDRGETDVDGTVGDSLSAVWPDGDTGTEYTYVYMKNPRTDVREWYVGDADEGSETLVRLEDALSGVTEEPKPNVKAFGGNFVIGTRKTKNDV
jgi:hypothetical protein